MTDTTADVTQSNSQAELRSLAKRLGNVLNEIAELQEDAKQIKAEAKSSGFNPKVFNQIVKEQRRGAEYQAGQLQLELELDTYRQAVGLPVTLEAAQEAVLAEAGELPSEEDAGEPVEDLPPELGPYEDLGGKGRGKRKTRH